MKDCITEKDFNKFLEDSLSPEALARIEAHCESCQLCARKFGVWKDLKEKLHNTSCLTMPANFKGKVMSRIAREKIHPVPAPGGIKRVAALALVLMAILYVIFRPFLQPMMSELMSGSLKSLSALLYHFLSSLGIDPAVVIRLFGTIMANMDSLLPVFMTSTAVMVLAFLLLIIKGRTVDQAPAGIK